MHELESVESEWRQLWLRTNCSPFQSPDWLLPWWTAFHDNRELYVIIVRRERRIAAILPLYRQLRDQFRDLVFVGTGNTDHLDIIAHTGDDDAVAVALRALVELGSRWDAIDLHEIPETSPLLRLAEHGRLVHETSVQDCCPMIELPNSNDIPLGSARLRSWLATASRKLLNVGRARRVDADTENCRELFDELVKLHTMRWQSKGKSGVLGDAQTLTFHHQVIERLCDAKLLRLFVLELGQKRVGAYYGFSHAATSYYYLSGFDSGYENLSIGSLLIAEAVEMARCEGRRTFDFLRGREPYKYRFGATDHHNFRQRISMLM